MSYLCVIVQVPQVEVTDSIHTRKQSRVSRRPHDIVHVIGVVLKRVQRLVVLQVREEKEKLNHLFNHISDTLSVTSHFSLKKRSSVIVFWEFLFSLCVVYNWSI